MTSYGKGVLALVALMALFCVLEIIAALLDDGERVRRFYVLVLGCAFSDVVLIVLGLALGWL